MNNIYSYSQVSRFATCPAAYKYNKELKALPSDAMAAGSNNHELIAAHLKNNEVPLEIGGPRLKAFIRYNLKNVTSVEEKINFSVLGYDYTGIIDAYSINGQTALIVDWKSNKSNFVDEKQLKLYALALTQIYPELQYFDCRFFFINQDYAEKFEFTRDEIDEFSGELIDGAAAIENETEFNPMPGAHCKYCAFVNKCPVNQKFDVPVIADIETATELLKKVFVVEAAAEQACNAIKDFMLTNDIDEIRVTEKDRFYIYNPSPQLKSGKIKAEKTEKPARKKKAEATTEESSAVVDVSSATEISMTISDDGKVTDSNAPELIGVQLDPEAVANIPDGTIISDSPDPLDATAQLFEQKPPEEKPRKKRGTMSERIARLAAAAEKAESERCKTAKTC